MIKILVSDINTDNLPKHFKLIKDGTDLGRKISDVIEKTHEIESITFDKLNRPCHEFKKRIL